MRNMNKRFRTERGDHFRKWTIQLGRISTKNLKLDNKLWLHFTNCGLQSYRSNERPTSALVWLQPSGTKSNVFLWKMFLNWETSTAIEAQRSSYLTILGLSRRFLGHRFKCRSDSVHVRFGISNQANVNHFLVDHFWYTNTRCIFGNKRRHI